VLGLKRYAFTTRAIHTERKDDMLVQRSGLYDADTFITTFHADLLVSRDLCKLV
jgi:hypothetical protein